MPTRSSRGIRTPGKVSAVLDIQEISKKVTPHRNKLIKIQKVVKDPDASPKPVREELKSEDSAPRRRGRPPKQPETAPTTPNNAVMEPEQTEEQK